MKTFFRKFFRWRNLPAYAWMGVVFYASSREGSAMGWLVNPWDKVLHTLVYAFLAMALCVWIRPSRWIAAPVRHALYVAGAVLLFGMSDEFHQSFVPGRTVSLADLASDLMGTVLLLWVWLGTRAWRYLPEEIQPVNTPDP